ncbi:MAG: hypothetical protein KDA60_12665 [Planctomycetales bacterium]|nr:hypothetical protein [Planctomycetales bacterium]
MRHSLAIAIVMFSWWAFVVPTQLRCQSQPTERTWETLHRVLRDVPNTGNASAHVFLLGEPVSVRIPGGLDRKSVRQWRVADELGREHARGGITTDVPDQIIIGDLPVGWYRVALYDEAEHEIGWTTAAVLAKMVVPTPQDSPICVDSATAWFAKNDPAKQQRFASLAALAGVNWVRDRMSWREMQPAADQFASGTTYESAAKIQNASGLKVLQVHHDTPRWAMTPNGATGRFPDDLRHVYRFAKAMAVRYRGQVQAWEPWNEPNVATFGGHTMGEICSYQKAAYLGFKSGDPDVTVGWSVTTATPTEQQTDTILANESWSYFDTFNFHTYDWAHEYERLWAPVRRAACGKPIWITESDRGMKADPASPVHDLSADSRRLKAQYVTQSYVQSLYAGANRHFHFILGQYGEGETEFGLLRRDLTPRPGYVALATLGRILAGARCLGRLEQPGDPDMHVYAFRARPDGEAHDVLVAWVEKNVDWPARGLATAEWQLPAGLQCQRCLDYLGRDVVITDPVHLTSSPIYLVLPTGKCDQLPLARPEPAERRVETHCSLVLQCVMPRGTARNISELRWASEYEYSVDVNQPWRVPVVAYNFGSETVRGTIRFERLPAGCQAEPAEWTVEISPLERVELMSIVTCSKQELQQSEAHWVTLRGDFGTSGRPVLAFRFVGETGEK